MKKLNKIISILLILLFVLSTTILATTTSSDKAKLEIVENNVCTISINNVAKFEKKIIDYNLEEKELTLELKVSNTAETLLNKPSEIFLVIDNSLSMKEEISTGVTRLEAVTDSATTLANELLKIETVKVGIVSFSTGDEEGTITDANLLITPTAVKDNVTSAISTISNGDLGVRTNIDAGITLANQNFSEDCENKFIVLLTDGVPNATIGGPILTYSGETATKTKAKLQQIDSEGVTIFSVMTGVPNIEEPTSGKTYKALAEEIFGTQENPTVGKFYYIPDSKINETITETVLSNFIDTSANTLTNLKIYDYFPQEIIDNFDFNYVTSPNIGKVSSKIDLENKCIIWTIDSLEPGDVANLSYKLTLKENINTDILDKIINTNNKVDITANQIVTDDGENTLTSDVTPKVKITVPEKPVDNTTADTDIPQTGSNNLSFIFIALLVVSCIYFIIRINIINKTLK